MNLTNINDPPWHVMDRVQVNTNVPIHILYLIPKGVVRVVASIDEDTNKIVEHPSCTHTHTQHQPWSQQRNGNKVHVVDVD